MSVNVINHFVAVGFRNELGESRFLVLEMNLERVVWRPKCFIKL